MENDKRKKKKTTRCKVCERIVCRCEKKDDTTEPIEPEPTSTMPEPQKLEQEGIVYFLTGDNFDWGQYGQQYRKEYQGRLIFHGRQYLDTQFDDCSHGNFVSSDGKNCFSVVNPVVKMILELQKVNQEMTDTIAFLQAQEIVPEVSSAAETGLGEINYIGKMDSASLLAIAAKFDVDDIIKLKNAGLV